VKRNTAGHLFNFLERRLPVDLVALIVALASIFSGPTADATATLTVNSSS
jgi:hypothetical protein